MALQQGLFGLDYVPTNLAPSPRRPSKRGASDANELGGSADLADGAPRVAKRPAPAAKTSGSTAGGPKLECASDEVAAPTGDGDTSDYESRSIDIATACEPSLAAENSASDDASEPAPNKEEPPIRRTAANSEVTRRTTANYIALPPEPIVCHDCKLPVDVMKKGTRQMGKQAQSWRCSSCNSKCTSLSSMFGGWPIEDFRELTSEQKTAFFQTSGTKGWELRKAVQSQIVMRRLKSRWTSCEGTFQPLSWYEKQGYDTSLFSSDLEK